MYALKMTLDLDSDGYSATVTYPWGQTVQAVSHSAAAALRLLAADVAQKEVSGLAA